MLSRLFGMTYKLAHDPRLPQFRDLDRSVVASAIAQDRLNLVVVIARARGCI